MSIKNKVYFHIDLDAFYASVEQLDNPQLVGKPVIIGGNPNKRGVVSTCSYEARQYGVHSGMPTAKAVSLCPNGIFIKGRMERYVEKSIEVMSLFFNFSPNVQQISIDEAFLDMTGTEGLFGTPQSAANKIKKSIMEKTGLSTSIGIGTNKYIAKIASSINKPNGLFQVLPGDEVNFINSLKLKDLWGIGEKSQKKLKNAGLKTIKDLNKCSLDLLQSILGDSAGLFLTLVLQGKDPGIFNEVKQSQSISSEKTFSQDLVSKSNIETALLHLSEEVMYRLYYDKKITYTIQVKIRYSNFKTFTVQETQNKPINNSSEIFNLAKKLFYKKYEGGKSIRLLGVAAANVTSKDSSKNSTNQLDLFSSNSKNKTKKIEEAMFELSQKIGKRVVTKARLIEKPRKAIDEK